MFIYKITNKINGKIYIGQTVGSVEKRLKQHIYAALYRKVKMILYSAIVKHGSSNFIIEEIGGSNSLSELNYLETHYIYKYKSLVNQKGYNVSAGGGSKTTHNTTRHKLSKVGKGRKRSEKTKERMSAAKSIAVFQYKLDGTYLQSYSSMTEACNATGVGFSSIAKNCKLKTRQASGFLWSFVFDPNMKPMRSKIKPIKKKNIYASCKKVAKVDNNGTILETYASAKEASLKNSCDNSSVCAVCNGRLKSIKKMLFTYII